MTCCTTLIADYWSGPQRSRYLGLQTLVATLSATVFLGARRRARRGRLAYPVLALPVAAGPRRADAPAALAARAPRRGGRARRLPPLPWRQLLVPCLVTLVGGIVFYALIVQLSFVLDDVGVTATATIGGAQRGDVAGHRGRVGVVREAVRAAARAAAAGRVRARRGRASPSSRRPGPSPVITAGAVITGAGTGLLLPVLLTWAINRLRFEQRGRGTGLWTGFLFVGEFLSPLLIAGFGAGAGGLQPGPGHPRRLAAVLAVVALLVVPRSSAPLNVTSD